MSLSAKLELENRIFARAAKLGAAVHAKQGGLISPARDVPLQTLLYVYNMYLRAGNVEQFGEPGEALEAWNYYRQQNNFSSGWVRIYRPQEITFEIILSERK